MIDIRIDPLPGTHIAEACREAVDVANQTRRCVKFTFNDIDVEVQPDSAPESVAARWSDESDRKQMAWENSAEGQASAVAAARRLVESQRQTDLLMRGLPNAVRNLGTLIGWCVGMSKAADHIGVQWDSQSAVRTIEAAGYVRSAHVGRSESEFNTATMMGEYIVGQALAGMAKGMPPHPIAEKFAVQAGFLPSDVDSAEEQG